MPRILIIDSHESFARLVQEHLSTRGFQSVVAHRADDGMVLALKFKPELILLDGLMPDATGFQMCTRLRAHPETQRVPIILMSGIARYANQQQFAFERGANACISKPKHVLELGEWVETYIAPPSDAASPKTPLADASQKPAAASPYTVSTDIHMALNPRLRQVLQDDNTDDKSPL